MKHRIMPFLAVVLLALIMSAPVAFAACSAPAGNAGDTIYNADYHVYQFCNGTNWNPMGPMTVPPDPYGNLVVYYRLDDGSGTTAADSSGNGNTGTLTSVGNVGPLPTWTTGIIGGALSFNAANSDAVYSNASFYFGLSSFTEAAWVNTTQTSTASPRIMGIDSVSHASSAWLDATISTSSHFSAELNDGNGYTSYNSGVPVNDGSWHHVALVVDRTANEVYLYVDGAVRSTTAHTYTGNFGTAADLLKLNVGYQVSSDALTGTVDDVRVYNAALSAAQIQALYNMGVSACASPAGKEADMIYNSAFHVYQFCNGAQWVGMGPEGSGGYNTVFITSTAYKGNIGSVAAANTDCATRATAAGLAGTYKAWIAISAGVDDPATTFTQSAVPYKEVDGTTIASNWAGLTSGTLTHAITLTETGATSSAINVWTNVNTNGVSGSISSSTTYNCTGWLNASMSDSANIGTPGSTTSTWTKQSGVGCPCSATYPSLYCFQQDGGGGGCTSPTGNEADIVYNSTHNVMQFCNGTAWVAFY